MNDRYVGFDGKVVCVVAVLCLVGCNRDPTPEIVAERTKANPSVSASLDASAPVATSSAAAAPPSPSSVAAPVALFDCYPGPKCRVGVEACDKRAHTCVPIEQKVAGTLYNDCDYPTECSDTRTCCETGSGRACVARADVASRCQNETCQKQTKCPVGQVCSSSDCYAAEKQTTCGGSVCKDVSDDTVILGAPTGTRECVWLFKSAACTTSQDERRTTASNLITDAILSRKPVHAGIYECTTTSDCGKGFTCCAMDDAIQTHCRLSCAKDETPVCATSADCSAASDADGGAALADGGGPACIAAPTGMPGLKYCKR